MDNKKSRDYALILGVRVCSTSIARVLEFISQKLVKKEKFFVVTPNPEIIMRAQDEPEYKNILNSSDLAIPDGIGIVWASCGVIKERVSGIDLTESIIEKGASEGWRLYFLGGKNTDQAMVKVKGQYPQLNLQSSIGPILSEAGFPVDKHEEEKEKKILKEIEKFSPDILFVGFGAPKQERWVKRNLENLKVGGVVVIGGAFDFLSGQVRRAPQFIRKIGFEWLFRLLIQPWRIKRQTQLIRFILKNIFFG